MIRRRTSPMMCWDTWSFLTIISKCPLSSEKTSAEGWLNTVMTISAAGSKSIKLAVDSQTGLREGLAELEGVRHTCPLHATRHEKIERCRGCDLTKLSTAEELWVGEDVRVCACVNQFESKRNMRMVSQCIFLSNK